MMRKVRKVMMRMVVMMMIRFDMLDLLSNLYGYFPFDCACLE